MLLSVETINTKQGVILEVWEVGAEKPRFIKPPFLPYYYSLRKTAGKPERKTLLSTLKPRTVWKVKFYRTDRLKQSRNNWTIEDDVPFDQRIAIDLGYKHRGSRPRILAWDIESVCQRLCPDWRHDTILSIACWGDTPTSHKFFYGNEKTVITDFLRFVREFNPDVLCDYWGRFYDVLLLKERCRQLRIRCALGRGGSTPYVLTRQFERRGRGREENTIRIKGRVHFDVHRETDSDYSLVLAGLKDRKLKTVAKHYGLNPIEVTKDVSSLTKQELRRYNLSDARCTYQLAQIYLGRIFELA